MEMMHALSCLLLLATVADAQRPARGAHVLMGTWRLVEFADLDKNGKWQYRFGEHPRGYFVYDATGHVHIQIMKTPPLPMFLSYVAVVSLPCAAQQDSSIRVTVVDSQAATVSGAEVRLTSLPSLIGLPAPDGSVSFKNVAPGTYQISATARGFRDEIASDVVVVAGKTTELTIKLKQALPKASDFRIHQTLEDAHLYSKTLTDIGQPLLCSQPIPTDKEWYRFMWMPTFDHPAFLRVDIDSEGSGTLLTQVWRAREDTNGESRQNRRGS